jgi:DNA-binding beta-propeller fold protein YncE
VEVATDSRVGSELLGLRLEALVGRGGMGVVYRAFDPRLKRHVALKLLAPELSADERFRQRFLTESELAAALEHPNVVPIHDAGEADGQLYLVMRLVEGSDLKRLLQEGGQLSPERAIAVCTQLAAALDAAHERGLVHRDVKPSNVLVDPRGHAYLADFGLTRRLADQAPGFEAGLSLGTPAYVAPEQIDGGEVDGRADQYSLACLLLECLRGEPPFPRSSEAAVLFAHLEEQPPTVPELDEVLRRGLAKDPAERYETCAELVEHARVELGVSEPRRSRWPLAVVTAVLALAVALLAVVLTRAGDPAPATQQGRLVGVDPGSNEVTSSVTVGDGPAAVAVGSGRVWVASYRDGTLWQFDPETEDVRKVPAFGRPYAATIDGGSAYVASLGPGQFAGNVSKFDAVTGGRVGGIELFACSLASGDYGVWAAGCPNVQHLATAGASQDPRIRATVAIPFPEQLTAANYREALMGLAAGEGSVWTVGDASDRRLWRIDPARHRIVATIELGFPPGGVAAGGGAVWVTDQLGDRLVWVDPRTNRVAGSVPVGRGAGAVAFGGGSVWVAGAVAHTVTRVDAATKRVVATIGVPVSPTAVAADQDVLWVAGDAR